MNELTKPTFTISITNFEGPFDTILELVRKNKLNLLDLNIEHLVELYTNFLDENLKKMSLEDASDYMLIASKLLSLKARYINNKIVNENFELNNNDDDIITRLITYKLYKDVVPKLNQRYMDRQLKLEKDKGNFSVFQNKNEDLYRLKNSYDINKLASIYSKTLQLFQHERLSKDFAIKVRELSQTDIQNTLVDYLLNLKKDNFSLLEYFYTIEDENQTIEYFCGLFVALLYQIKIGSISYILIRNEVDIGFEIIDRTKIKRIENNV